MGIKISVSEYTMCTIRQAISDEEVATTSMGDILPENVRLIKQVYGR
jgi:hypothetical protein